MSQFVPGGARHRAASTPGWLILLNSASEAARQPYRQRFSTDLAPDFGDNRNQHLVPERQQIKAGRASSSGDLSPQQQI
jgi:hypothetical protein